MPPEAMGGMGPMHMEAMPPEAMGGMGPMHMKVCHPAQWTAWAQCMEMCPLSHGWHGCANDGTLPPKLWAVWSDAYGSMPPEAMAGGMNGPMMPPGDLDGDGQPAQLGVMVRGTRRRRS